MPSRAVYFGKICKAHPDAHGERYACNQHCVQCARDIQRRYYRRNRETVSSANRVKYQQNPEMYRKRTSVYKSKYPEAVRRRNRINNLAAYNLTEDDYAAILAFQGGACAICRKPPKETRRLDTDHDHATGLVRGLLCYRCNTGKGIWDNREMVVRRLAYLDDPPAPKALETPRYTAPGRVHTKQHRKLLKKLKKYSMPARVDFTVEVLP